MICSTQDPGLTDLSDNKDEETKKQRVMASMTGFERSLIEEKLHDAEQRLSKSRRQFHLLDEQLREIVILSYINKNEALRFNINTKYRVVSNMRMLYFHYMARKGEEISRLRRQLLGNDNQLGNNRSEQM